MYPEGRGTQYFPPTLTSHHTPCPRPPNFLLAEDLQSLFSSIVMPPNTKMIEVKMTGVKLL